MLRSGSEFDSLTAFAWSRYGTAMMDCNTYKGKLPCNPADQKCGKLHTRLRLHPRHRRRPARHRLRGRRRLPVRRHRHHRHQRRGRCQRRAKGGASRTTARPARHQAKGSSCSSRVVSRLRPAKRSVLRTPTATTSATCFRRRHTQSARPGRSAVTNITIDRFPSLMSQLEYANNQLDAIGS